MSVDLSTLKEPVFVFSDWESLYKEIVSAYERAAGVTLSKGQVESILLSIFAYRENLLRIMMNEVAKQNLLAYARGEVLDHLGALLGVSRLPARPAITTLRFYFDQELPQEILLPRGTRVASQDRKVVFATDRDIQVSPGTTYVDVTATCETPGTIGNGYLQGQITELIDVIPYIASVENISISYGGADVEDDEHFRERIQLAPEHFSTAGTEGGYRYWAMTAHQDIADVAVWSDSPGHVRVAVLMKGGGLPSQEVLDLVQKTLSAERVRPLTDWVSVEAPEQIFYEIKADLFLYKSHSMLAQNILEAAQARLERYAQMKKERLGQDIVPEQIVGVLQKISGVYRAIVISPSYIELKKNQVAICQNITITIAGSVDG